jgi:hypothetical protein
MAKYLDTHNLIPYYRFLLLPPSLIHNLIVVQYFELQPLQELLNGGSTILDSLTRPNAPIITSHIKIARDQSNSKSLISSVQCLV